VELDSEVYASWSCTDYKQESCAVTKMTAQCADKSKQTASPPPKIM